MSNPSKRKGTKWETDFVTYMRKNYHQNTERLTLNGSLDQGDVVVNDCGHHILCELKNEKSFRLAQYIAETERERINYSNARNIDPNNVTGIVVIKRRMRGVGDGYVLTTVDDYFGIH